MERSSIQIREAAANPYRRQIAGQMSRRIRSGDLPPDSPLPSIRGLARQLLVSALAVKQAYADLEAAGLVVRRSGSGVFVASDAEAASRDMALEEGATLLFDAVSRARRLGLTGGGLDLIEGERLAWEVEVAARIQRGLLPGTDPALEGYDISGLSIPCREVGGDLYDFLPCAGGELALAIADITGKGIPASLLVSTLHASLHLLLDEDRPLTDVISRTNRQLHISSPENRFAGLFLARLHPPTGRLRYVNAGQDPPLLLRRDGSLDLLTRGGLPVGCSPDAAYESEAAVMEPGDLLLATTDGITETLSAGGEEFGGERLVDHVCRNRHLPAVELAASLITAAERFSGGTAAMDDRTVLVVKRHKGIAGQ
jgi:DNA-binding transcriptional regulator YhcF (GntR family)